MAQSIPILREDFSSANCDISGEADDRKPQDQAGLFSNLLDDEAPPLPR